MSRRIFVRQPNAKLPNSRKNPPENNPMKYDDEDTVEEHSAVDPVDAIVAESFDEDRVEIGAITHRGRVRSHNEDQFAVIRRTRCGEVLASSVDDADLPSGEEVTWLLSVADGVGGQTSGEVASATAIQSILHFACELSSWIMRPTEGLRDDIAERVDLYSRAINRDLKAKAESNSDLAGMATTLTSAYIYGDSAVVVNVGDSRSYLVQPDGIQQITRDHTLAQDLLDAGLPPASTQSYTNILTRCFSTEGEPVPIDVFHVRLSKDDSILLCSDGLTDMLPDDLIQRLATAADSTKEACQQLVIAALEAGGRDNITVVLARMLSCVNEQLENSAETSAETLDTDSGSFVTH